MLCCARRSALATAGGLMLMSTRVAAQGAPQIGAVERQAGETVALRGGRSAPLTRGSAVHVGDRIRTGDASRVLIRFSNEMTLIIGPVSEITLSRHVLDTSPRRFAAIYALFGGIVRLVMPPRAGPCEIDIVTRAAVASVRQTEWIVDEKPNGSTGVFTVAGTVGVRGDRGPAVSVAPAFGTDVAPGEAPSAPRRWGQARVDEAVARLGFR